MTDKRSPQARAAETKKLRTQAAFIRAADETIKHHGWDVTVDQVCAEARMSPASFYSVFESKGDMFRSTFREVVLASVIDADELRKTVEGHGRGIIEPIAVVTMISEFVQKLNDAAKGREKLVRGALAARLNAPPVSTSYDMLLRASETHHDPVLDVVALLATLTMGYRRVVGSSTLVTYLGFNVMLHGLACLILDAIASGAPCEPDLVASIASAFVRTQPADLAEHFAQPEWGMKWADAEVLVAAELAARGMSHEMADDQE
jgi:AcrR family transcriptional regulator